ncbi:MAG: hypothetical protein WBM92_02220 [Aureibaculum sp.]
MKTTFNIELLKFSTIYELPNGWNSLNYKELLEAMDYGDASDLAENELKEMCLMSLSDNEPEEAAKIVLEYVFKDRFNAGQINNLSHEMLDESMWEEYADLAEHEEFFNVHQLLYQAYNGKFPYPEAVQFKIQITTKNKENLEIFDENSEPLIIRLLAQGMPENTIINRLFSENLKGGQFKEAKDIIWQLKKEKSTENSIVFEIVSSEYWFKDLKYANGFDAEILLPDVD